MPYIPYKFKIKFEDDNGVVSSMSIIDWEIPQLYLNCKSSDGEEIAVQKVKDKLINFTKIMICIYFQAQ